MATYVQENETGYKKTNNNTAGNQYNIPLQVIRIRINNSSV